MLAMILFLVALGIGLYVLLGTLVIVGVKGYFKTLVKAFCFRGRTERREFWSSLIAYLSLVASSYYIVLMIMEKGRFSGKAEEIYGVFVATCVLSLFPWLAAEVRRMRDVGVPSAAGCIMVFPQLFCWVGLVFVYLVMKNSDIMAMMGAQVYTLVDCLEGMSYETGSMMISVLKKVMIFLFALPFLISLLPSRMPKENMML